MNQRFEQSNLEDRLKAVGSALRTRPQLKPRIIQQIREAVHDDAMLTEKAATPPLLRRVDNGLRGRLVSGGVAGFLTLVVLFIAITPSPTVGWAQVAKKLQEQKWIRGRWNVQDKNATTWVSPAQQIWAYKLGSDFYFYDGTNKSKYEYHANGTSITKLPLGENRIEDVLPLAALRQNESSLGTRLFGSEKIVQQERREVTEGGKTWIEFHMVLARGEMNQGILRVDPDTKLPVYFIFKSPVDETKSVRQDFDFPSDGPADIFELGVPRSVQIDDLTPDRDALHVLAEIVKSRAQIGDFRLLRGDADRRGGSVIYRKGTRWRIDRWRQNAAPVVGQNADMTKGGNAFLKQQLQTAEVWPYLICDGTQVWQTDNTDSAKSHDWKASPRIAPDELLSGISGSLGYDCLPALIFPNLSPKRGWTFEYDPHPVEDTGCVLIKTGAQLNTEPVTFGHDWYYLDPLKGYAVVHTESFTVPIGALVQPDASDKRSTFLMEGYEKTKQGFWYPRILSEANEVLRTDDQHRSPEAKSRPSVYYEFDFETELPDSLFLTDDLD